MKRFTLLKMMIATAMMLSAIGANAATSEFSLNEVYRSNGDLIEYTPETGTAVINGDWQYVGWKWETPTDLSAFDWVFIEFDATGLPDFGDGTDPNKLQFAIVYGDGEVHNEFRVKNNCGAIKIDKTRATSVKEVFLKVQKGGTLILKKAWAATLKNSELPLDAINDYSRIEGAPGATFDKTTNTVTFNDDWQWVGLNLNELKVPKDISAYDSLIVELAEPASQDFVVVVNTGAVEIDLGALNGVTSYRIGLSSNNIENIYLKGKTGSVVVSRIYFKPEDADPVLADFVIGTYSLTAGFTEFALANANPSALSFAIKVNSTAFQAILDGSTDRVLALSGVRISNEEKFANGDIRFTKGTGDYVYYIENYDLGNVGAAPLAPETTGHLHSQVLVAGTNFWWDESTTAGWNPGEHYLYLGTFAVPAPSVVSKTALQAAIAEAEALVEANYTAESWATFSAILTAAKAVNASTTATQTEVDAATAELIAAAGALVTGLNEILADPEVVAVEYYNILGAKLATEPASGLYLIRAIKANGSATVVKVAK